jgi:hypothetical protein
MELTEEEKALIEEVNGKFNNRPPLAERDENYTIFVEIEGDRDKRTEEEKRKLRNLKLLSMKGLIYWDVDFEKKTYKFFPIELAKQVSLLNPL